MTGIALAFELRKFGKFGPNLVLQRLLLQGPLIAVSQHHDHRNGGDYDEWINATTTVVVSS